MSVFEKSVSCKDVAPLLVFYACDEVSDRERKQIEAHVANCRPDESLRRRLLGRHVWESDNVYASRVPVGDGHHRHPGRADHRLNAGIVPERLSSILTQQRLPRDWIAAIFDSTGAVVARTHEMNRFLDRKVLRHWSIECKRSPRTPWRIRRWKAFQF